MEDHYRVIAQYSTSSDFEYADVRSLVARVAALEDEVTALHQMLLGLHSYKCSESKVEESEHHGCHINYNRH